MRYLFYKIIFAIQTNTLISKSYIYFKRKFRNYFILPFNYFFQKKSKILFKLTYNKKPKPNPLLPSIDTFKQIFKFYEKYGEPNNFFLESKGVWDEWIEINFRDYIQTLHEKNLTGMKKLFNNIYREPVSRGIGGFDDISNYRKFNGSFHLKYTTTKYLKIIEDYNIDKQLISYPNIGNPFGPEINNEIIPVDSLRHLFKANEILKLTKDFKTVNFVEIGAGMGGLIVHLLKNNENSKFKIIIYDLPEVLTISFTLLKTIFPLKKIYIQGENSFNNFDHDFDILFLTPNAINFLKNETVDFFYNSCSFSEMDKSFSNYYLEIINKKCRKYFMHDNFETNLIFNYDRIKSSNLIGSKIIPDKNKFKLLYKRKKLHGLPEDRDHLYYEYLYEKK